MQLLPVVQRELLVAARQRMTYLSRTISAGILLPLFVALHSLHSTQPAFAGPHILSVLSTIVFFECMLAGIRYTSDCISEERREGTLGLLFLTDLTGLDIVLGKVLARSLRAVFNLLATFPILALTLFVGGVTGTQITTVSITLFVCILFSLAAGAFISSRGYRERNVLLGTLLFLILTAFVPLILNSIAVRLFNYYGFADTLIRFSPYYAFSEAGLGFTRNLGPSLGLLLATTTAFLFYAAWRIRRTFGEPERLPTKSPVRRKRPLNIHPQDPLLWLARRDRIPRRRILQFSIFVLVFGVFSYATVADNWNWAIPIVFFGSYALHAIYKFLLTAETCRQINEDRRSGALEILLSAPVSSAQLVRAQLLATWRAWFPAMIALACMNYFWMSENSLQRDVAFRTLLPCSLILLVADTIALPWRSVLLALSGERYPLTVFKTYLRAIVPPLALVAFMLAMIIGSNQQRSIANCFILWTVLCLIYNTALILNARARLQHLRLLAAGDKLPSPWRRPDYLLT